MSAHMRFSIIPGWCATDRRLTGRDLQVLCVLGRHVDREGWCTRSQVKIAAELGCSRGTVQNSLKRLGEIGVVEVRANETADGRDCAHDYRILFDGPAPKTWFGEAEKTTDQPTGEAAENTGKTLSPPCQYIGTPANPELAPPASPELAPYKNDPLRTEEEREGAGARERVPVPDTGSTVAPEASAPEVSARGEAAQASDHAGTDHDETDRKALTRRVKAMELGPPGGKAWPGAAGSSTEWAVSRFAELSPDERERAETLRSAYLALCEAERVKPVALGVYFRDRKFEGLNPELARRAAEAAEPKPEARPFGPVWAALRMRALLAGPEVETGTDDPFAATRSTHAAMLAVSDACAASWRIRNGLALDGDGALAFPDGFAAAWRLRQQAMGGWPSVSRMDAKAGDGAASPCAEGDMALADLCEPVPIGSTVWREWEGEFAARGWPWLPKCGARPVVYFPKGGPDGLDDFAARLEG